MIELPGLSKELIIRTDDGAELATRVFEGRAGAERVDAAGTVVLSHCWAAASVLWQPVARGLLEEGHKVVLYDHRGHGESSTGTDPWTLSRLAADMATVLEQLNLSDVVIAGHSMGGFTTITYAVEHPDSVGTRVRGLALISTAAHGLARVPFTSAHARLLRSGLARWMDRRLHRIGRSIIRTAFGRRPCVDDLEHLGQLFVATPGEVRARSFLAFVRMDERRGLAKVDVPAVVATGTRDRLTPPRLGRAVARAMPRARFELVPEAGHMLPVEAADEVTALIHSLTGKQD